MNSKSSCSPSGRLPAAINYSFRAAAIAIALAGLFGAGSTARADAPTWMHALVNAPVPAHDEKTDAVLLYSEDILNVQSSGKMKKTIRRAYKILRPGGKKFGQLREDFD